MTVRPRRIVQRLRDLVAWGARDRDMQQEMQFHLESLAQEYMKGGMSEADARRAARRQFGSMLQIKERGHDVRGAGALEQAVREMRHAARRLLRTPGFTLAAVLTLALAIGANVSMFTIVHRVVLNPLPYPDSDRLIDLDHGAAYINVPSGIGMKVGLYNYYSDRARTLDGIAIFDSSDATLTGDGDPERIRATRTTTTLASVLGVSPAVGRWFTDEEGTPGAPQVAVISHGLWMRRYGGNAGVIGRPVTIDGVPTDVVDVMPDAWALVDGAGGRPLVHHRQRCAPSGCCVSCQQESANFANRFLRRFLLRMAGDQPLTLLFDRVVMVHGIAVPTIETGAKFTVGLAVPRA